MKPIQTEDKEINKTLINEDNNKIDKKAKMFSSSSLMSVAASQGFISNILPKNGIGLPQLVKVLESKIDTVQAGNLEELEAMLVGQSQALQTIFASLARKASRQTTIQNLDLYMRLAFKAQSQSRSTIQALIELKFPRHVSFVKQANISHGHQQVNNEQELKKSSNPHTKEKIKLTNELLEEKENGKWVDSRAKKKTIRNDPKMEALGAKHWS